MIDRATRLRWRRHFRRSKRQVEDIGVQAEENIERHFIKRLSRLYEVRRFVIGWLVLFIMLIGMSISQIRALSSYYQDVVPVPGGIYIEGVIGQFTNANPLYATGGVDAAVSRLLFAGLLTYNSDNQLTSDLAKEWSVDASERRYTVVLRDNLKWHDGEQLTAEDVAYTFSLIQNPETQSVLFNSFSGVKIETPDEKTVIFTLPNVFSAFAHTLTTGILPKHKLENISPGQLRSDLFNNNSPVGAGPFKWEKVEVNGTGPADREEVVGLLPHDNYHFGPPKLQRFTVRAFREKEKLLKAFENQEITAAYGLETVPEGLQQEYDFQEFSLPVAGQNMVFFNMSHEILKDQKVRQALIYGTNQKELISGLGYPAIPVDSPFLKNQFPYDPAIVQFGFDQARATQLLDEAGWIKGSDGIRSKDGKLLQFRLDSDCNEECMH